MAKDARKEQVPADLSFEEAVERIESLIDAIEGGEVGLEQSIEEYEKGMKLISHCKAILDRAETRITKLTVTEQGDLTDDEATDHDGD